MWAIVPYKEPPCGKSRLSNRLTLDQRIALATTMLEAVVSALSQAESITGTLLVSNSTNLDKFTKERNTIVLATQANNLKDAVTQASVFATNRLSCRATFIVPADLPLISTEDVDNVVVQHEEVTILPDARLMGTNGIVSTPPNVLQYVFNGQSFHDHQKNARDAGIHPKTVQLDAFSYDVDTFEDLLRVIERKPNSTTATLYRSFAMHDNTVPRGG